MLEVGPWRVKDGFRSRFLPKVLMERAIGPIGSLRGKDALVANEGVGAVTPRAAVRAVVVTPVRLVVVLVVFPLTILMVIVDRWPRR